MIKFTDENSSVAIRNSLTEEAVLKMKDYMIIFILENGFVPNKFQILSLVNGWYDIETLDELKSQIKKQAIVRVKPSKSCVVNNTQVPLDSIVVTKANLLKATLTIEFKNPNHSLLWQNAIDNARFQND